MKKLFAAAAAVSILAMSAGPALAGSYQGVATRNSGRWQVIWDGVAPVCTSSSLNTAAKEKPTKAIVDGIEVTLVLYVTTESGNRRTIVYDPSPDGDITSIRIDGQASISCEGHTLLLPNSVAPPTPVPTMTEWAMILLGVMLAGAAALTIHRRRTA